MKIKTVLISALLVAGVLVASYFAAQKQAVTLTSDSIHNLTKLGPITITQAVLPSAQASQIGSEYPVRLKIPKIKVDAALEYVGITSKGALGVPKNLSSAAWYDLGPRPGDTGTAVIDGHFGWENNVPAVFNDLRKLTKGDNLIVEGEKGSTTTFVVTGSRTLNQDETATDVFSSRDGRAHLNLITCKGTWDDATKSYPDRLIVFADKSP